MQPGGTVAIVGAGPIGLASLLTALLYSPAPIVIIDRDEHRLEVAEPVAEVMKLTGHIGVDCTIEAVGCLKRSSCARRWLARMV